MPRYLTAAVVAVALWVICWSSGRVLVAVLPGLVALVAATLDYALWERRSRPWHDWTVIVLLLPAIAAAVWIAVGGLVMGADRSDEGRLLFEVGPGIALTGLLCTLISYHGRHHPAEGR